MSTDQTAHDNAPQASAGDTAAGEKTSKKHPVYGTDMPQEVAGPPGPEPTRYGDWEVKGRCSDF